MKTSSKICVVIPGSTFDDVHHQIVLAQQYADLVELRLDHFHLMDKAALTRLRTDFSIPMIFTLRSHQQGGKYKDSEELRLQEIKALAALNPEYLDLESHVPTQFLDDITANHPDIKLIISHHDFTKTPHDLDVILQKMQMCAAHHYKIAVHSENSLDTLRLLTWAKDGHKKIIPISMGKHGQCSRILGPIVGSPICYATIDEKLVTAPGQLTAKTLSDVYRYHTLNPNSLLWGLIGDPIDSSTSDIIHNHMFKKIGIDGVYIKMQLSAQDLSEFFQLIKKLPFRGLSVTMPLKEAVIPYIDIIDPQAKEIKAVNTLLFDKLNVCGFNTDGFGALNAIERQCSVKNKKIVIIGAGGAAKAIAFEACRRGGEVTILNRDAKKALQLATQLNCIGKGLEHMSSCFQNGYDIIINSTPAEMPIDPLFIRSESLVMDIKSRPKETPFIKAAQEKDCRIVYGYQMFIEQAIGQYNIWFKNRINADECRELLEQKISQLL